MNDITSWWDIAQKVGSGAAFVLGVAVVYLWRAYLGEVKYSKERDKQTLEVLIKLTTIVEGIERRDDRTEIRHEETKKALLEAIADLKDTITNHFARHDI